jgi:ferric-dicitrate binding protein FerR (iron transport regulator)
MKRTQNYYIGYTEEQFAADEYFQQWVLQPDSGQGQYWESYLRLHPAQRDTLLRARLLVEELAANDYNLQPLSGEEKAAIKDNIYSRLTFPAASGATSFSAGRRNTWQGWTAAAAILAIIAVPVYLLVKSNVFYKEEKNSYASLLVHTGAKEMKRIVLEDSTVVLLNANSSLRYSSNFQDGSSREVQLEGNAFFSVQKDSRHAPFMIHAHSLTITVLGTELNVNARSKATEVELTSGKVKVEQEGNKAITAYLQPGEKIELDTARRTFIRSKMNTQLYSAWTEGKWNFRQTSLEDITGLLREYYGVDIVFQNERSRHLRINAVIAVTSLQKLIPVIEHTLQIKIVAINNQLIVQ